VVPGGGSAYIRVLPALEQLQLTGDRQVGVNIIKRALETRMRQIVLNAGAEGARVVQRVKAAADRLGYDVAADPYVDLMEAGVLYPPKGKSHRIAACGQCGRAAADHGSSHHRSPRGAHGTSRRHGLSPAWHGL
jgi:chaperonin GroEL (HSP60 family)